MRIVLVLIMAASCLLAAGSWAVYSNTWDEPEHLAAGLELLDRGHYEYDTEHPPLARVLLALGPYLAGARSFGTPPPDGTQEGRDILYSDHNYARYLTLARAGTLPFLLLLLWASWLWARRLMQSQWAALAAVAVVAALPPILGHAGLATLDIAAAATQLIALYALERWLGSARWQDAVSFGASSGVAVACKFSAVPFIGMSLLFLGALQGMNSGRASWHSLEHHPWRVTRERLLGLLTALLAALIPILAVYTPRAADVSGVEVRWDWAVNYLLSQGGFSATVGHWLGALPLPREFKDLVNGVIAVKAHNDAGHRSYLLGQVSLDGWWYFYLVTLAVKTPVPLLVAGPIGLAMLARRGWRERDGWSLAPAVLVLSILAFAMLFSRINIGIRHVLILYPFLALGGTYAGWRAWRALVRSPPGWPRLAGRGLLLALALWQASPLWRSYPDYLTYFNETVREPRRVLVDSDLDWGQDLKRLEARAAALRIPYLYLAYRGTADLQREPLPPFEPLKPRQRVDGWVAISALARTRNTHDYAWLDAYAPLERIGSSIELYYIP